MKKYELTSEKKQHNGTTLYRINALKDFSDVKQGDLGGWLQGEHNLSQAGDCWVYDNAVVSGFATVLNNATVLDNAVVCDKAVVYNSSIICDKAVVSGNAIIHGNAVIKNN